MPSKGLLFNRSPKSRAYRRHFFDENTVSVIINFSIYRKVLFDNATAPCTAIIYYPKKIDGNNTTIFYCTPKPQYSLQDTKKFSIDPTDICRIPSDLVCDDRIWKIAMWGSPRDLELIDRLQSTYPSLDQFLLNYNMKSAEGFKRGNRNLLVLDDVKPIDCIEWDYTPPFVGFRHFLDENSISDYSLTIDREGEHQKTVLAARKANLKNVDDEESDNHFGIRMADMLAGVLGKLMKSLCKNLHPTNPDVVQKTILHTEWFDLSDAQLALYKKLHHIVCELNNAWYKSFAGVYADDLVCINTLLNFMSHFESAEEIKSNVNMQGEYFNAYTCQALSEDYRKKQNKLPIEPVPSANLKTEYFFNQRGAKVYIDAQKQPMISIPNGSIRCKVLSVGADKNMLPLITVEEDGNPVCYRLPLQLSEWAFTMVAISNMGQNLFPSEVVFSKKENNYYANII